MIADPKRATTRFDSCRDLGFRVGGCRLSRFSVRILKPRIRLFIGMGVQSVRVSVNLGRRFQHYGVGPLT